MAALLPPGSLGGEPGRLLTTFLGLVAASILPTISLIVGGMVTGSRSVKQLTALGDELGETIDVLFAVFGLIAMAAVVLMALAIPVPYGEKLPSFLLPIPSIVGQGVVGFIGVLVVCKSGTIPGAIRRSLDLRTQMAVDDAKKKTLDNADEAIANTGFRTRDGFGKVTNLADLRAAERTNGDKA